MSGKSLQCVTDIASQTSTLICMFPNFARHPTPFYVGSLVIIWALRVEIITRTGGNFVGLGLRAAVTANIPQEIARKSNRNGKSLIYYTEHDLCKAKLSKLTKWHNKSYFSQVPVQQTNHKSIALHPANSLLLDCWYNCHPSN